MIGARRILPVLVASSGCVLADPAPSLPLVPEEPPIIESALVPSSNVFSVWPSAFEVPVSLTDPSKQLYWIVVEDLSTVVSAESFIGPVGANDGGSTRIIRTSAIPRPSGPGCHTVEMVIAYGFVNGTTPVAPGGAVVRWTYIGNANVGECVSADSGYLLDGTFPDSRAGDAGNVGGG